MKASPTAVTSVESMATPPSLAATLGAMAVAKLATTKPSVTGPKYACTTRTSTTCPEAFPSFSHQSTPTGPKVSPTNAGPKPPHPNSPPKPPKHPHTTTEKASQPLPTLAKASCSQGGLPLQELLTDTFATSAREQCHLPPVSVTEKVYL